MLVKANVSRTLEQRLPGEGNGNAPFLTGTDKEKHLSTRCGYILCPRKHYRFRCPGGRVNNAPRFRTMQSVIEPIDQYTNLFATMVVNKVIM